MLRIGLVDIETSHRNRFTDILHAGAEARVTMICPGNVCLPSETEDFVKRNAGVRVVAEPKDMVNEVDMAFILGTNWDRHLDRAMPFIERGKPVFIDKPIVGNLRDCARIEQLVRQGARIAGSSSLRYFPQFAELRQSCIGQNGGITYASAIIGNTFFEYGIHAVEMLGGLLGPGAVEVRWLGGEMPIVHHVLWKSGARATLCLCGPKGTPICAEAAGPFGYRQLNLPNTDAYTALMNNVVAFALDRPNCLATIETLTESVRIALAAEESRRRDGATVALKDLDTDAPGFSGTEFAADYGARKRAKK